jgi:hypothetical protein
LVDEAEPWVKKILDRRTQVHRRVEADQRASSTVEADRRAPQDGVVGDLPASGDSAGILHRPVREIRLHHQPQARLLQCFRHAPHLAPEVADRKHGIAVNAIHWAVGKAPLKNCKGPVKIVVPYRKIQ